MRHLTLQPTDLGDCDGEEGDSDGEGEGSALGPGVGPATCRNVRAASFAGSNN